MGKTYKESQFGSKLQKETPKKPKRSTKKLTPYNRNEFKKCQD